MKIFHSKKGFLSAEKDGRNIHSLYNPNREAERFIAAYITKKPSTIAVLGTGLGYLLEQLNLKYPDVLILAVFYDDELYKNCFFQSSNIYKWHPSSKESISSFFNAHIREIYLKNIQILQWNPTSLIYKKESLFINKELKKVIQQLNGNIKTTAVFGKKWIRNMICNYLFINSYVSYPAEKSPIVIVSSGPTLEKSLSDIKKYRKKFRLWALPSSLRILQSQSISPDMLISTDPGFYGSVHLQYVTDNIPVAMPLTASRGLWKTKNPTLILNQNSPFEKDLYDSVKIVKTNIPSNGTVSGTALELALLNSNFIFFAGLDLCYSDIQSHTSPHSFDNLLNGEANRIDPLQSIYFKRAAPAIADFKKKIRTPVSLETYKNWFNFKSSDSAQIIKRLNPSPVIIDNMDKGNLSELAHLSDLELMDWTIEKAGKKSEKSKTINLLFDKWEKKLQNGTGNDLFYFIDTETFSNGGKPFNAVNYIKKLRGIYGQ